MSADQSRQLNVGDVILSVNGESMSSASHNKAVKALKKAGPNICLEIKPMRRSNFFFQGLEYFIIFLKSYFSNSRVSSAALMFRAGLVLFEALF